MDRFNKLPRDLRLVVGGSLLYIVFSFFDWQQVSAAGFTVGVDEWHGVGVVAGLLVFAVLLWEAGRYFGMKIELGTLSAGLVSVSLALLLLVFTIITFLSHSTARHWPAWIGLVLSIVIGLGALRRAKAEDVHLPVAPPTN
jgi:hypothetical protein